MESASIRFPPELLARIDAAHGPSGFADRSEWVRHACREQLKRDRDLLPSEATLGDSPDPKAEV